MVTAHQEGKLQLNVTIMTGGTGPLHKQVSIRNVLYVLDLEANLLT